MQLEPPEPSTAAEGTKEIAGSRATGAPATCEGCGKEADTVVDGRGWCVDCWAEAGSCCAVEP